MFKKILFLFFASVFCLTGARSVLFAANEATTGKLDNGLEIILVENHASPIVSCNVFVKAGVSTEPPDMNGVSHFLEHLLFNGTQRRSQKELYDEVDFYGAYNNAFTREDYTGFQMIIASPFLEKGLDIQSDMLFYSTIPEDKYEKEKGIVIEEIGKDRGNPDYLANLYFKEKAFSGTPYSRPILGTVQSISDMKRDDVLRYYKSHYVPNNMILFLFGDFKPEEALELINHYFGAVESSKVEKEAEARISFKQDKNFYRNKMETGRSYLDVLVPAPFIRSEKFFPFTILISVLSEGEDSRLHKSLKMGQEPLVYQYSLDHINYGEEGLLHFSASIPEAVSPDEVAKVFFKELQNTAHYGISAEELKIAQKSFKASEIYLQEQLHYYVMMRAEWLAHAQAEFLKSFLQMIENQNLQEVNATAKEYFGKMTPVITVSSPQQEKEVVDKYEIPPYETKSAMDASKDRERRVLDNGMTIITKREPSTQIFAIHLLMKNRALNEPEGKTGIADFTHRMFLKGTALMDSADLAVAMKEIGAKAKVVDNPYIPYDDYYTSPLYSYIRFEILSENHIQGLKLLKEIVFHPSFLESEISTVTREMGNVIKKNQESLAAKTKDDFLFNMFSMTKPGNSVTKLGNSVYGSLETVSSITKQDLFSFHQRYFSPENMIVSIVSDIPVERVMKNMEEIFGTIKRYEEGKITMPAIPPTPAPKRMGMAGGEQQSYLYAGYLTQMDTDDLTALSVANSILSDRLAFQLRERQGLAYRVGSTVKLYGNAVLFYSFIGTRPENIDKAEEGILKEIASFADSELAEKELEKTINSMIGRHAMRRVPGINRAYFMGLAEFQGLGYTHDLGFVDRMKGINKDQIKKVAKKYFDTSRIILLIAR